MRLIRLELARYKRHGDLSVIDGAYLIPHPKVKEYAYQVIASTGMGWDHVSVCLRCGSDFVPRCPTWIEMCWIKDLFFEHYETVIQYHPARANYVNTHSYVLHLWRPQQAEIPMPDPIMV